MKKISFILLAIVAFFPSCNKKVTLPTNNNNATAAATPSPSFTTGDGYLVTVKTITSTIVAGVAVNTLFGSGVAGFGNLATPAYVDVGIISLQGREFTKNANNTYTFIPPASNPLSIDLTGSLSWSVAGGNGIPAFTFDASVQGLPVATDMSTFTEINTANNFTLSTTGAISNSDSVYFQIAGNNGTLLLKRMGANTNTVTYTAAELQTLGTGTGSVSIVPWNHGTTMQGGKTIHIVNEVALSRIVDIK